MKTVLDACLEGLERWREKHDGAMTALDAEDLFHELMGLHRMISEREERLTARALEQGQGDDVLATIDKDTAARFDGWLSAAVVVESIIRESGALSYESSSLDTEALTRAMKRARGAIKMAALPLPSNEERVEVKRHGEESRKAFHELFGW